jgi:uncharacterized protein
MRAVFALVIGVFALIYGGLNYYIGTRGWQAIGKHSPYLNNKVYWVVFWVLALSYLLGRLLKNYLPAEVSRWLTVIGSYWMGFMFYMVLILALIDLVRGLNKVFKFLPAWFGGTGVNPVFGLVVMGFVVSLIAYGTWNAAHPKVRHYDINIDKQAGNLKELHLVMVSDIHLGTIVRNGQLIKMVNMINELNPDMVVIAGDAVDESVEQVVEQQMADNFRLLKSKYGVFAALGNHEYISGNREEAVKFLQSAGVHVLRDQSEKVADSLYVLGREDSSSERFAGAKRKKLADIMSGVDKNLPVIVIDHQPSHLEEAISLGVDLQLSGHTHSGQMFPNNLITGRMFEDDWGLLTKGPFNIIVSSGYGTWGPPIRIGNYPEVVDITLHFK